MSCHNSHLKTTSLSHISLLANVENRVSRQNLSELNIPKIITDTLHEKQITPRFSGQFLLDTVKLYKRKIDYLLRDCNEMVSRIQLTFQQDSLCIQVAMGDIKTIDLSAPVDLEAAFGQTAPLRQQLFTVPSDANLDVDNNWNPDLWCDRNEPCEKPQLLDGDLYIDIGDSTDSDSQTIMLRPEPSDSDPWFGQEDQRSGSEEDFQTHDPTLLSKRPHLNVFDEASAPAKRRRSSRRNVMDVITVLPPLSGMVSKEILLPRNSKHGYNFNFNTLHREWPPEFRDMLSLDRVMEIRRLEHNDDGLEADKARTSTMTVSQHQTQMTLDGAADLAFPNSSWIDDTDDDSRSVTPVSDAAVVPRNNVEEGPLQAFNLFKSQLAMLEENTPVRFEDLFPPDSTGKAVASVNFLAVLNLATMGLLKIDQEQEGHSEGIGLVAGASFQLLSCT